MSIKGHEAHTAVTSAPTGSAEGREWAWFTNRGPELTHGRLTKITPPEVRPGLLSQGYTGKSALPPRPIFKSARFPENKKNGTKGSFGLRDVLPGVRLMG